MNTDRDLVLNAVIDAFHEFVFFDRVGDKELPSDRLERLIRDGVVTKEEIIARFRDCAVNPRELVEDVPVEGHSSDIEKELVFDAVGEAWNVFIFYARKHDKRLPWGRLQQLTRDGVVTNEEIAEMFKEQVCDWVARIQAETP